MSLQSKIVSEKIKKERIKINKEKLIPDYKKGELDRNSSVGFAFISQRVVAKFLGLELKYDCNCEFGFKHSYDLYDEHEYGKINVKASTLKNNSWNFSFKNIFKPDIYICVGFSGNKEDIIYVSIIKSYIINKKNQIRVSNSNNILRKYKQYEVDVRPYNYIYHSMSIENCSIINNKLKKEIIVKRRERRWLKELWLSIKNN